MWCLTRPWPWVLAVLLFAPACGGGSPTGPSTPWFEIKSCELPTLGAMTATLDGTPWIPVSTRATWYGGSSDLQASDCTHTLTISLRRFKGLGTYELAGGGVEVDLRCDGKSCGAWKAGDVGPAWSTETNWGGSGSVTVTSYTAPTLRGEPSGAIEGTFSFTIVPVQGTGATGTRVITNGRFGSRFGGL